MTGPDPVVAGPPVRLGGTQAGAPIRTSWDATSEPTFSVNELGDLDDVTDQGATLGVLTRETAGQPATFVTLPAEQPRPTQHVQTSPSFRWQLVHGLGYRPNVSVHDTEGRLHMPENVEHPVPGEITEIVFGVPMTGTADPS